MDRCAKRCGRGECADAYRRYWTRWLAASVLCAAVVVSACSNGEAVATLAIDNVTIVDGAGPPRPGHGVVVAGGRILTVAPMDEIRTDAARRLDGAGAFVVPGFWDMHVHLVPSGAQSLATLVANGVTSVRDLGGDLTTVRGWQDEIEDGTRVGPRILAAGTIIEDREWLDALTALSIPAVQDFLAANPRLGIASPSEARAAVDRLAAEGVDLVKVRTTPPWEAFQALAQAADARGLQLVGHLPDRGVDLMDAVRAGFRGIEHVDRLSRVLDRLNEAERAEFFTDLAGTGVPVTPTLVALVREIMAPAAVTAIVEDTLGTLDPRRRQLSKEMLTFWRMQQALDDPDSPPDSDEVFVRYARYAGEMHRRGVPLLAGTDMGARLVYPGYSVHDELALLVERAGLTPGDAIASATLNAARASGVDDAVGTVAAGMRADLVILNADPLEDIRNTRRIRAVVLGGELLDRARLDSLLWAGPRP